ncbi:hypothetical protein PM082_003123 [Marasmius tenuissimus]|nr:hypothetical protein PM082_003123 [Marasmius tenuissimus]
MCFSHSRALTNLYAIRAARSYANAWEQPGRARRNQDQPYDVETGVIGRLEAPSSLLPCTRALTPTYS